MTRASTPLDVIEGRARWCVVEGDATDVLRSLQDGGVCAVITDPPYGIEWRGHAWDADTPPQSVLSQCLRVATGGVLWFAGTTRIVGFGDYDPRPDRVIAWVPPFTVSGARSHGMRFHWDAVAVWRGSSRSSRVFADVVRHDRARSADADWSHGCTKPVRLMRDLVAAFSDDAEVVCDPFAGSGTTGVAALMEGRRVILVERDPVHVETCRRRCEETEPGVGSRRAKQLVLGGVR